MDTSVLPHIPALIAAYMRAAAGRRPGSRIGPFTAGLDAHSAASWAGVGSSRYRDIRTHYRAATTFPGR
jgi:hypothetical protein